MRARKIFLNFGFLTTGKILGDLFTFLFFVVVSRTFGKEGIGQYSIAMALTGFFAVFSDYGLYPFTIKELSRHTDSFREYYGRIVSLRLVLSVVIFGLFLSVLPILPFSYETKLIIAVIGAYQVLSRLVEGIGAAFIAREDTHFAGFLEATFRATGALAGIGVIFAGGTIVLSLATLPIVAFGILLISYLIMMRKYGKPKLTMSLPSLYHMAREATPYGLSLFFFQLTSRVDVVLLGLFLGEASAGVYNVANRVVVLLIFVPYFASVALFPSASKLYLDSKEDFKKLYHRSLNACILIGLPTAAGLCLTAPSVIHLLFGKAFSESILILRMLAFLLFLAFLNRLMAVFLQSSDRQVARTKSQAIVACVNIIANLILIPHVGIKGAAIAALVSQSLLLLLFVLYLKPVLGWPKIGSRVAISSLGAASFCLPFAFFPSLSPGLVIPASTFLYSGVLLSFKQIRENEIRMFLNLVRGEAGPLA